MKKENGKMKNVLCVIICLVICLPVLSGTAKAEDTFGISGDAGRVGLEDSVYALQVTSGVPVDKEIYNSLAKNTLKSAFTAAQLYFVTNYPNAGEVTITDMEDYGYIPVEEVELETLDSTQDTLWIWAKHLEGNASYLIDNKGFIRRTDVDNYNFIAEVDIKKAYIASQSFFEEYPDGTLTWSGLADSGFNQSEFVEVNIYPSSQSTLMITTHHVCGDKTYSVDSAGVISVSQP